MNELKLSTRFLDFLADYAHSVGKDPGRIVEEAVSQAILRHRSPEEPSRHDARLLMPDTIRRQLFSLLPDLDARAGTESPFGVLLERLPDKNWTYQICRLDEWWFVVISEDAPPLPEPIEVKSVEVSQAYCWIFGYTKTVKVWSGERRFVVAF